MRHRTKLAACKPQQRLFKCAVCGAIVPATKYYGKTKLSHVKHYVHGVPGSGKTHICTAVCSELIKTGQNVKYVIWTDIVQQMRSVINEREYRDIMESLKRADTLYIDDFLKGSVSDADIKRAFEIINARYNLPSKKTIISSERSLDYVRRIDAAVAGRIKQRCKGFYIKTQDKDWRF